MFETDVILDLSESEARERIASWQQARAPQGDRNPYLV